LTLKHFSNDLLFVLSGHFLIAETGKSWKVTIPGNMTDASEKNANINLTFAIVDEGIKTKLN
jgi:hypothetical protein